MTQPDATHQPEQPLSDRPPRRLENVSQIPVGCFKYWQIFEGNNSNQGSPSTSQDNPFFAIGNAIILRQGKNPFF